MYGNHATVATLCGKFTENSVHTATTRAYVPSLRHGKAKETVSAHCTLCQMMFDNKRSINKTIHKNLNILSIPKY